VDERKSVGPRNKVQLHPQSSLLLFLTIYMWHFHCLLLKWFRVFFFSFWGLVIFGNVMKIHLQVVTEFYRRFASLPLVAQF